MRLFFFILFISISLSNVRAQTPIYGEAILFSYDAMGNRQIREYHQNEIINLKPNKNQNNNVDTAYKIVDNTIIVKAYPNPVADELNIQNFNWDDNSKVFVELFDATGKLILQDHVIKPIFQVHFSGLASGSYFVNYIINNESLVTWKIIKP